MAAINLEAENVVEIDLKLEEARRFDDDDDIQGRVSMCIDEAQGLVHMGKFKAAYVIIRIGG